MKYKSIMRHALVFFIFCTLIFEGCKKTDVSPPPPPPPPPKTQPPTITKFSPTISGIGYPVTITGTNFSTDISLIKVTISGASASVVSATNTQVIATVPLSSSTGKISVSVNGQSTASASDIKIIKLTVSTFAGGSGYTDGTGTTARFSGPLGIVSDRNGNFYIADTYNSRIRKMTSNAVVTTLSGSDIQGNKDGSIDSATFYYPRGIAMDSQGNLFVTSINGSNIRKITPNGIVSTFAGDPNGSTGFVDATGAAARFTSPGAITIDGNDNIFVTDGTTQGSMIRKITSTGVVTTFAGSGLIGSADGNGTSASFNQPAGLVTDPNGNLFVSDYGNNNIRKITPAGDVTTFAGNGTQGSTDGPALSASFYSPFGIVRDPNGNFYITESDDKIRIITSDNIVISLAGDDQAPSSVDGVGKFAGFSSPTGIAIGPDGVIYVLDSYYSFIRKMIVQ